MPAAPPGLRPPPSGRAGRGRGGGRALGQLAPGEARRWYAQALEQLDAHDDDERRREALIGLGEAQRQVGDPAYRQTLLDAARRAELMGDADHLARAMLATSRT